MYFFFSYQALLRALTEVLLALAEKGEAKGYGITTQPVHPVISLLRVAPSAVWPHVVPVFFREVIARLLPLIVFFDKCRMNIEH